MSATPTPNADLEPNGQININHYAKRQLMAGEEESKRLRANASLPHEAWESIDDTVYPTMDAVLTIVSDLRAAGLTTSEDINAKTTEWHVLDDDHDATIAMQPETATDEGNVDFDLDGAVLPMIQDDFSIGFRDGGMAGGPEGSTASGLETLNAEASARTVAEAMENLVINGWDITVGSQGYTSYGLTNHPDAHTGGLSDWSSDPMSARADLRQMASDIKDDKFWPGGAGYNVYLSRDRYDALDNVDNEGTGDLLVRDRVENLADVSTIKPLDFLDPDSALMFRPTTDVIDLAFAADEQTVQWDGPFRDYFKVMAIMTPRVKSTKHNQCGISYYSA